MAIVRPTTFTVPRAWNKQTVPTWPAEIDPSCDLAAGLSYLNLLSPTGRPFFSSRAAGTGVYTGTAGNGTVTLGPRGLALRGVAQGTWYNSADPYNPNPAAGTCVVYMTPGFDSNSLPVSDPILTIWVNSSVTSFFAIDDYSGSNQFQFGWYNSGSDYRIGVSNSGLWSSGDTLTIGGTWNSATPSRTIYVKGGLIASNSGAFTAPTLGTADATIGGFSSGGSSSQQYWNNTTSAAIYYVAFWDRDLSAQEMLWINAEPLAMLRPVVRRAYFLPPAAVTTHPRLVRWR